MNPPNQLTIAPTPRTDAAYFATGATMYSLAGEMKLIERELTAAQAVVKAFPDSGDDSLYNVRRLRAELAAAKAECERLTANQRQPAEDIFVSHLCDELTRLRAELEVANHSIVSSLLYNTLKETNARLRAEVERLKGALALGQQNCDDAYDDLREERDEAIAKREKAEAELANIANAKPDTWGDMSDSFQAWAQSRARHALAAMKNETPTP
jgi:chromosome segregation ATPase